MKRILVSTTLALAAATPFAVCGADGSENLNRFSLGPRFGYNFKADFNSPAANPGPAAGGADHTYNDGYNLVDSSGNAGGLTWNWGYQNDSQVVGDTMQFHAVDTASLALPSSRGVTDDPQVGFDLTYQRIMGHLSGPACRWGLEASLGYTDLDLRNNRTASGDVTLTTDSYALNGVLPPGAGYSGTFNGPGPLIGDTPTRITTTDFTTLSSHQSLSGHIFSLQVGPFAEWNYNSKLSFALSAGVTLAPAAVDYDFSETSIGAVGGTSVTSGHASTTELLYGLYVGGTLRYHFTEQWGVYVGVQYQTLTDMEQSIGPRTARLNPQDTVNLNAGITWRF
jgi:hypothetical protein